MKSEWRVVLFPEDEMWVAQCLTYDITAQAHTPEEAVVAFEGVARRYAEFAIAHGRIPFSDFGPAPQRFHKMYAELSRQPNGPRRREFKIPYPNPHRASAAAMHDEAVAFELAAA